MKKILITLGVIVMLFAAWYFLSPLIINSQSNEEFDPELAALFEQDSPMLRDFDLKDDRESVDVRPGFLEDKEEPQEVQQSVVLSKEDLEPEVLVSDSEPEPAPVVVRGPKILSAGSFVDADNFHQGSGQAVIVEREDGTFTLAFNDFQVTNGPDLRVYLTENSTPTDQNNLGEHIELGKLKGSSGNQSYIIPAGTDLSKFGSVMIYCKPFHVVFSYASLR